MVVRYLLRLLTIGLSTMLYATSPPQGPTLLERGPMQPRAVVRPPRLGVLPSTSAR
jgi:hypothetical protein